MQRAWRAHRKTKAAKAIDMIMLRQKVRRALRGAVLAAHLLAKPQPRKSDAAAEQPPEQQEQQQVHDDGANDTEVCGRRDMLVSASGTVCHSLKEC